MMRGLVFVSAALFLGAAVGGAQAQQLDLSGKWSLSGLISGRGVVASFAQICDLKQSGDQLAGPCHGPNGGCSAVGLVAGANVDFTCRTTVTNNPGLAGVTTFHGAMGADDMVRGSCVSSRAPGVNGVFAMMRI
jgi:hypothetical protein